MFEYAAHSQCDLLTVEAILFVVGLYVALLITVDWLNGAQGNP